MKRSMKMRFSKLFYLKKSRCGSIAIRVSRAFFVVLAFVLTPVSVGIAAQNISPQMMQQLQSMPRAQQEALAAQYGVDLDQLMGAGGITGASTKLATPGEGLEQREVDDSAF